MITLAIPNYNGGGFLGETLCSLERSRPFVRWWMQDGHSTDDSISIAQRFVGASDRIVVCQDEGQADALNRAFQNMGGDILGFINSDDRLCDGAPQAILTEFERDPSVDIVYGEVDWINEFGDVTGHHTGQISSLTEVLDIYRVWWNRRHWVQPEVFWRRRLWERVGPFNTRYDLAFDYDYWVRCFQAGAKVKRIPRTLAQFRRHAAQKSVRSDAVANEIRNIVGEALASGVSISRKTRKRLEVAINYDRYQSGQDYPAGSVRPSFGTTLMRRPKWMLLPSVRQRIVSSAMKALAGK